MGFDDNYGGNSVEQYNQGNISLAKVASVPSLQQRLDHAVAAAEERLKAATEARDILARNPDLEKLLNIMQKGHF